MPRQVDGAGGMTVRLELRYQVSPAPRAVARAVNQKEISHLKIQKYRFILALQTNVETILALAGLLCN